MPRAAHPPLRIYIGAGCYAQLRWPSLDRVEIQVEGPSRKITRRINGRWARADILGADSQVRAICSMAIGTHLAPPLSALGREG